MPSPSPPSPPPLSRHRTIQLSRYSRRLEAMVMLLDALPDRNRPLTRGLAGRFRRTLGEGRALLGLPPTTHLDATREGAEFFLEWLVISHHLDALKAAQFKATPRAPRQRCATSPAPW